LPCHSAWCDGTLHNLFHPTQHHPFSQHPCGICYPPVRHSAAVSAMKLIVTVFQCFVFKYPLFYLIMSPNTKVVMLVILVQDIAIIVLFSY
jgi:hypothetical protein